MKQSLTVIGVAMLLAVSVPAKEPAIFKMTTEIPEGIATPDKEKTSIGTLKAFDGVPDAKTTKLVYEHLYRQRALAAFLSFSAVIDAINLAHLTLDDIAEV